MGPVFDSRSMHLHDQSHYIMRQFILWSCWTFSFWQVARSVRDVETFYFARLERQKFVAYSVGATRFRTPHLFTTHVFVRCFYNLILRIPPVSLKHRINSMNHGSSNLNNNCCDSSSHIAIAHRVNRSSEACVLETNQLWIGMVYRYFEKNKDSRLGSSQDCKEANPLHWISSLEANLV